METTLERIRRVMRRELDNPPKEITLATTFKEIDELDSFGLIQIETALEAEFESWPSDAVAGKLSTVGDLVRVLELGGQRPELLPIPSGAPRPDPSRLPAPAGPPPADPTPLPLAGTPSDEAPDRRE